MTSMSVGDGPENPIEGLAHLIDLMDVHVHQAETAAWRSEGNRISILYVHALYALLIGPSFAAVSPEAMTGPLWAVLRHVPGVPWSMGALMFAGGVILTVSTTCRHRAWEIAGLTILIIWYGTVAVSFTGGVFLWLLNGAVGTRPSFYAPLLYSHFLTVMAVHIVTLRRMMRAGRRR